MDDDVGSGEPQDTDFPERPPDLPRRSRLYAYQLVGMTLIVGVVVAALSGAFGETRATSEAAVAGMTVRLEQPKRFRYQMGEPVTVSVTNTASASLDTVTVAFDTSYMSAYSEINIVPSPLRAWEVELTDVAPGETRLVVAEIQAERYWRHRGTLEVSAPGLDTVRLELSTFTLP